MVKNEKVYFHNYHSLICLSLETGREIWEAEIEVSEGFDWAGVEETLVAQDSAVFFLGPEKLVAFSSMTGKKLWTKSGASGTGAFGQPPDLFVTDSLLWYGGPERNYGGWPYKGPRNTLVEKTGYNPITGEGKKEVKVENLITPGHHFRCYRSKATTRYLLWPKRGVEFLDLQGDSHQRNDWFRASCKMGLMPGNGLLYAPPHQCFCYPATKINGFNAVASQLDSRRWSKNTDRVHEKGSAYGQVLNDSAVSTSVDWPAYRHDAKRSGSTPEALSSELHNLWEIDLKGKITQPTVVKDKIFVSQIDAHRIRAFDNANGKLIWSFTAGGRVDSPPTYYKGLILFGSADGWVYCLRASDGELVWRFQGAPQDRQIVSFGQLESAWPIHGSVLIKDGVAYFAAGRSSYLDGGIHIYGLEPETGKELYRSSLDDFNTNLPEEPGKTYGGMKGSRSEILVSEGEYIYLRQVKFNKKLQKQKTPQITALGDKKVGLHLLSTSSLLDDSWWDRSFWMYSERWPGFYFGQRAPKAGHILVFDDSITYGVKGYERRNILSPMHNQGQGHLLFADYNTTEPTLVDSTGKPEPVQWLPGVNKKWIDRGGWGPGGEGLEYNDPAVNIEKGPGFTPWPSSKFYKSLDIRSWRTQQSALQQLL